MAHKQYRWYGEGLWQSSSGSAIWALQNFPSSGKRVLVHSARVHPRAITIGTSRNMQLDVAVGEVAGGEEITATPRDTAGTLPSGIKLWKNAGVVSVDRVLWRTSVPKNMSANPTFGRQQNYGILGIGTTGTRVRDSSLEQLLIEPGEHLLVYSPANTFNILYRETQPQEVFGTFVVHGTPNRTYDFSLFTWWVGGGSDCLVAITNDSSSTISLRNLQFIDAGDTTTPYFQLVPVGALPADAISDAHHTLKPYPVDSAYGALDTSQVNLFTDVPILPYGVPAAYAADGGAATPKGMNYLHTRDFLGPRHGLVFPELSLAFPDGTANNPGDITRVAAMNNSALELMTKGSPLVLREGEGVALVSAMEGATSSNAQAKSGRFPFSFEVIFSTENLYAPSITVTGFVSGSDIVILEAGTDTVLAQVDQATGASWGWEYDADVVDAVDICLYKQGYVPLAIRNIDPGVAGITIPVVQTADRNFTP